MYLLTRFCLRCVSRVNRITSFGGVLITQRYFLHGSHNVNRSEGDVNISVARKDWQQKHIDADTLEILSEDAKYFLHQALSTPCLNVLKGARGIYLEDEQGRLIMDFHGNSVHQVGYGNEEVISAVVRQMQTLPFCPRRYTNTTAIELAKKLASLAPGDLNRVLFCPGGTSAVGMALKLARMATGKYKTISMWESFHGASLDSISVGGEEIFRANIGPLLAGTEHVPPADEYRCAFKCSSRGGCDLSCAEYIEYVIKTEGDIAAVIAEPIRWTPYIPRKEYWEKIRQACDKYGVLLIFDEIPNSLGRTGTMFTCENFVQPDILVLGKGLGGGIFPLACIIAREHLNEFGKRAALGHYTHEKTPVGCAAALATINFIEKNNLLQHAKELGEYTIKRLKYEAKSCPLIGDVRGSGLLIGVELVLDKKTKQRAVDEAEKVMYGCMSKGLSFKLTMGNIVTLVPPLIITKQDMDKAIDILIEVINNVSQSAH